MEKVSLTTSEDSVALYDVTCKSYDELYGAEQNSKYNHVLEVHNLKPKGYVLDIGCGTGLLLEYLRQKDIAFKKYICIEPSSCMIKILHEKRYKGSIKSRVLLINGYAENLPLREGSIDTIYMFTVWDNVGDKRKALEEIIRVLKDGGYAVVSFLKKVENNPARYLASIMDKNALTVYDIGCEEHDCFIVIAKSMTHLI